MNKFLMLTAAFLFTFSLSRAQTEKGTQTIGLTGGVFFNQDNNFMINPFDNSTNTVIARNVNFSIGPQYSYFIADKLEAGANLSYSSSVTTNNTPLIATTNDSYPTRVASKSPAGSVFIRKYYMYKNVIGFRTGGYLGYASGNETISYSPAYAGVDNLTSKSNYYFGGATADLVYYPSKKLGIAANILNLEYEHYKVNNTTQGHDSGDILAFNFVNDGLSLAIFYVFGHK